MHYTFCQIQQNSSNTLAVCPMCALEKTPVLIYSSGFVNGKERKNPANLHRESCGQIKRLQRVERHDYRCGGRSVS